MHATATTSRNRKNIRLSDVGDELLRRIICRRAARLGQIESKRSITDEAIAMLAKLEGVMDNHALNSEESNGSEMGRKDSTADVVAATPVDSKQQPRTADSLSGKGMPRETNSGGKSSVKCSTSSQPCGGGDSVGVDVPR